jgi:hypothetical protein
LSRTEILVSMVPGGAALTTAETAAVSTAKVASKAVGKADGKGVLDLCSHAMVKKGLVDGAVPCR